MKCRNVVRDLPSEHGKTYDRDGAKRLNRNIARMAKLVTAGVVGVFSIVLTPHAYACGSSKDGRFTGFSERAPMMQLLNRTLPGPSDLPGSAGGNERSADDRGSPIVGMWITDFYTVQDGKVTPYDRTIEQFHADGTEVMSSALFPPTEGNVCFGVWDAKGPRLIDLNHVGWTFEGRLFTGAATLTATIVVSAQGDTFSGTFTATAFDPNGNNLPQFTATGKVLGRRFSTKSDISRFLR
jgi:hypothetical protein